MENLQKNAAFGRCKSGGNSVSYSVHMRVAEVLVVTLLVNCLFMIELYYCNTAIYPIDKNNCW